ncbi:unnamed protein product [Albugo candida]|uniref:Uncharacterized protein n=1 Tax=Albugo candida TaxID=65357 RepID=A0A024FU86_9STRA|nr:unnamed protein product [Albugo candida]|eukprot:CCI10690.1 unnamed protein product [Albugo candida]
MQSNTDQDINVPDEDKTLHNILAKSKTKRCFFFTKAGGSRVLHKDMSTRVQFARIPKSLWRFAVDIDPGVRESSEESDDALQWISDGADSGDEGSYSRKRAYGEETSQGSNDVS